MQSPSSSTSSSHHHFRSGIIIITIACRWKYKKGGTLCCAWISRRAQKLNKQHWEKGKKPIPWTETAIPFSHCLPKLIACAQSWPPSVTSIFTVCLSVASANATFSLSDLRWHHPMVRCASKDKTFFALLLPIKTVSSTTMTTQDHLKFQLISHLVQNSFHCRMATILLLIFPQS